MSATVVNSVQKDLETKTKKQPASKKKPINTSTKKKIVTELEELLTVTEDIHLPLKSLVLSLFNVCDPTGYSPDKIAELAESINALGLLQNIVVHEVGNDMYGVAAGGKRLKALEYLLERGDITDDFQIRAKVIPESLATAASMAENTKRCPMSHYEQIVGFKKMIEQGYSISEIGGTFGFNIAHVRRMLKLSEAAPELLEELSAGRMKIDQLQALAYTSDPRRQVEAWTSARNCEFNQQPERLRKLVQTNELKVEGNADLEFIGGKACYEQAGGKLRYDFFTDEGFICEPTLLAKLVVDQLEVITKETEVSEGWKWADSFIGYFSEYNNKQYIYPKWRGMKYSEEEESVRCELNEKLKAAEITEDEKKVIENELVKLRSSVEVRNWSESERKELGVIVSYYNGKIEYHRGVKRAADVKAEQKKLAEESGELAPDDMKRSASLNHDLSVERSLAVQAALTQSPLVVMAIFIHDCMKTVFKGSRAGLYLETNLNYEHKNMASKLPGAEDNQAIKEIERQHTEWLARFPESWEQDFKWLLDWDLQDLIQLQAFCLAGALCKVDITENQSKVQKTGKVAADLAPVEEAINFNLRDWWKPTATNYFGRISKPLLIRTLQDLGFTGAAKDVSAMKKRDAAEAAAELINTTRWVPECMVSEGHSLDKSDVLAALNSGEDIFENDLVA